MNLAPKTTKTDRVFLMGGFPLLAGHSNTEPITSSTGMVVNVRSRAVSRLNDQPIEDKRFIMLTVSGILTSVCLNIAIPCILYS